MSKTADDFDKIDAIVIGLHVLGISVEERLQARAKAGLIEKALNECGFVIVPKKPTAAMIDAAILLTTTAHSREDIYRAMIAVASKEE